MMMIVSGNKAIASRCLQKDQSAILYSAPEPASAPERPNILWLHIMMMTMILMMMMMMTMIVVTMHCNGDNIDDDDGVGGEDDYGDKDYDDSDVNCYNV